MKYIRPAIALGFLFMLLHTYSYGQKTEQFVLTPKQFDAYNTLLKAEIYQGKEAIVVEQAVDTDDDSHYSLARLKDLDFHNGIIEITLAGQPKKNATEGARGFVGIAFRVPADTSRFEVFYLRPTNGRSEDQERRNHTTQYVSYPGYSWKKLRKENPSKYESYADMVAGEWTTIKIEVKDEKAILYVNGAAQPVLIVNDLKQGGQLRGSIGLWLAIGTLAQFTELKVTKFD